LRTIDASLLGEWRAKTSETMCPALGADRVKFCA